MGSEISIYLGAGIRIFGLKSGSLPQEIFGDQVSESNKKLIGIRNQIVKKIGNTSKK